MPPNRIKNSDLAPEALFLLRNAIAPSTQRGHDSIRQSYERQCNQNGYYPRYPASIKTITHWLAEIVRKVKPATAKAYISALRSIHHQNHYDTKAFDDPRIDLILRGAKRIHGEGERRTRLPLTSEILENIIQYLPQNLNGLNIKAALYVAFARFLQSGEFTWDSWDTTSSWQSQVARKHMYSTGTGQLRSPSQPPKWILMAKAPQFN